MNMKMKFPALMAFLLIASPCVAQDLGAKAIRYRNGTTLSFDSTTSILDEGGGWTIPQKQLGRLAFMQGGTVSMTTNLSKTVTFSTAFASAPAMVVTGGGTNNLPYVSSVTSSNAIIGAAVTNTMLSWLAFPAQ